jgi:hypothetical protein
MVEAAQRHGAEASAQVLIAAGAVGDIILGAGRGRASPDYRPGGAAGPGTDPQGRVAAEALHLEAFPLGDVRDLGDVVAGAPVGVTKQRRAEQDPYDPAVLADVPLLPLVARNLAVDQTMR